MFVRYVDTEFMVLRLHELTSVLRTVNPSPASLVVPHAVISAPVPEVVSVVVSEATQVVQVVQVVVVVAARFMSQTFVPLLYSPLR